MKAIAGLKFWSVGCNTNNKNSMLDKISPSTTQPKKEKYRDKDEERHRVLIALIFLLLSFACIFCSSQTALWFVNESQVEASMLSSRMANYGVDLAMAPAPLDGAGMAHRLRLGGPRLAKGPETGVEVAEGLGVSTGATTLSPTIG